MSIIRGLMEQLQQAMKEEYGVRASVAIHVHHIVQSGEVKVTQAKAKEIVESILGTSAEHESEGYHWTKGNEYNDNYNEIAVAVFWTPEVANASA